MSCNLLMTLMQLDIGGAETHVVELSKEFKNRGYNVFVASNGGAYVKELEDAGIKHFNVPLHSKKPADMIKARKLLKKIITDEKIDIVHSHTRIASFILAGLKKSMGFSLITTAHWVFETGKGLKYLTNWGEKTVAVSEDIKKYLLENYKIKEEDIFVTINGIDTKKFSPDVDKTEVMKEFGLSEEDNVIVYISRLDEDRSLVAKQLIEAMPKLSKLVENLKVLVVGGGNDYENVSKQAKQLNDELGYEAVILTGPRIDINKLIAPAKLFVGVSRSALEAMAESKPVIIAGNEGYIGLFDEDKLQVGIDTNFCCRGCVESTSEQLANDIGAFFGMWDEDVEKLAEFGRNLILSDYSVKRMADDTEKAYMELKKI
ncbi:MAG: glycosyltransferase [Clostridia bacterium]|nr:glycosyltransferase [Clostridia bacterium]